MEITWHKDTCFTVRTKGKSVVLNPNKNAGKLKGEMIITSLAENAEVEGAERTFDWPGEYEMKNIPITGLKAWTKKSKEGEGGEGETTTIFCFQINKVKFCHLGELGHPLTSEMVDKIGDVDILMIKTGEGANLDQKAAMEVIEAIEPRVVIPMGDDKVGETLKDIGADKIEAVESFELKTAKDLPDEQMKCIVLKPTA